MCCSVVLPVKITRVVRFFHPRSSCMTHISADVQRITLNASCMTILDERTEQLFKIASFLPHHWLYKWFSQFPSCVTYSVLSQSPRIGLRIFSVYVFEPYFMLILCYYVIPPVLWHCWLVDRKAIWPIKRLTLAVLMGSLGDLQDLA